MATTTSNTAEPTTSVTSRTTGIRLAAACGVIASIGFTLLWIAAGFWEDNYSNLRQDVSDFGALTATHPGPYNTGISIAGVLLVVLAIGMFAAIGRSLLARIGCGAMLVFGACQFLDGVFREDCSPSGSKACRDALDAGDLSWHHQAHDIESVVWFASIVAAMLVLGFAFRRMAAWSALSLPSFAGAIIATVALVWYFALYFGNDGSAYSGVLERVVIVAGFGWAAIVALRLWSVAPDADPVT